MTLIPSDCPCNGKSMRNMAAPWILLTLHNQDGCHAYEVGKIIEAQFKDIDIGLNLAGLYRHLNQLEKRGMVVSEWSLGEKGPPKRKYFLTEAGRECLWHWINTLCNQMTLLDKFFDNASTVFPNAQLPRMQL